MSDPILCPYCEHYIDDHRVWHLSTDNCYKCFGCPFDPSDIARAYADERVREALEAEPTDAEVEEVAIRIMTRTTRPAPTREEVKVVLAPDHRYFHDFGEYYLKEARTWLCAARDARKASST